MGDTKRKGVMKDEVSYFFLIKRNAAQSQAEEVKGRTDITRLVRQEGGKCRLYMSSGGAFDFVSVITGITSAAALRIAAEIEKQGVVKATLMPSMEIYDPAPQDTAAAGFDTSVLLQRADETVG